VEKYYDLQSKSFSASIGDSAERNHGGSVKGAWGIKMEKTGERIVLCGASAYEQKYYFNEQFNAIPDAIKEELHIICVLFTEEVGGVFTIVFEEDASVSLETDAYEEDILYDEISSGLLVHEIRMQRKELLESLSLYYRVFVLHEPIEKLIEDEE